METVLKTILNDKLINPGETIAVACSGGADSVALLHFLWSKQKKLNINLIAVNVDHSIRQNSRQDSLFVENLCKTLGIVCYKYKVNVPLFAKNNKLSLEEAARICRYEIFDNVIKNKLADKIAVAHHRDDQVETILLNIFRGTGLKGASGMSTSQGRYIRPLLNTTKQDILRYIEDNHLSFVVDETNLNSDYSRNFLRNQIIPQLKQRWKNVDNNIISFANICKQDDEYISSLINFDDIEFTKTSASIPLYKLANSETIQNRIFRYCFSKLNLSKDIEKRHLNILRDLVENGKNGSKINLPNKLRASLEYDMLVLSIPKQSQPVEQKKFKVGKIEFDNFEVSIKKETSFDLSKTNCHYIDADKLPKGTIWRARENGDVFAKFGSGEKKLKDYMIDKKIPNSKRNQIPVLAKGNEVFCVLGYEISEKVKIDNQTKNIYSITYKTK